MENLTLHKRNFNEYLENRKRNSSCLTKDDLKTIREFLISKDSQKITLNQRLRKRHTRSKFVVLNIPGTETSLEKDNDKVYVTNYFYFFISTLF